MDIKPVVEIREGNISVSKKLSPDETYKISNKKNMFTLAIYKKPVKVVGVSSMCQDGGHVMFLDYDNISKWIVEADIRHLIKENGLGPFYLFCTKQEVSQGITVGNYHAICLTKMTPSELVAFQRQTHCDKAYSTMPLRNLHRSWVLRTSSKGNRKRPVFLKVMESPNLGNCISTAHLMLLKKLYNVPEIKYTSQDNLRKLHKNIYETGNV